MARDRYGNAEGHDFWRRTLVLVLVNSSFVVTLYSSSWFRDRSFGLFRNKGDSIRELNFVVKFKGRDWASGCLETKRLHRADSAAKAETAESSSAESDDSREFEKSEMIVRWNVLVARQWCVVFKLIAKYPFFPIMRLFMTSYILFS